MMSSWGNDMSENEPWRICELSLLTLYVPLHIMVRRIVQLAIEVSPILGTVIQVEPSYV